MFVKIKISQSRATQQKLTQIILDYKIAPFDRLLYLALGSLKEVIINDLDIF